ncbi:MAG: endonuclease [Schleiferiaceae bacterium]|nr:endonuclease [Schleiferiaceae bacterium]
MMRLKRLTCVLALAAATTVAQAQDFRQAVVARGPVTELQKDSVAVWMRNDGIRDLNITGMWSCAQWGDTLLGLRADQMSIAVGDSARIWMRFTPEHNVYYRLPVVVATDGPDGFVALQFEAQGRWSQSYYSSTENKNWAQLKSALTTKLNQGTTNLGYNGARDQMYGNLDNVNGQVTCIYTGRVATFNTRAGATANNMNCEHTFPQSFFSSAEPMKSDIHHLFPSDASANTQRSNNPFGIITGTPAWSVGGSKRLSGVFEPRDAHKGDAARAMMYFVTRFGDYSSFYAQQAAVLEAWHQQFPPDSADRARNQGIAALQNTRNPYVDYPQIMERLISLAGSPQPNLAAQHWASEDTLELELWSWSVGPMLRRRLVVTNPGSDDLILGAASLSAPNVNLVAGGNADTLKPGELHTYEIEYPASVVHDGGSLSYSISAGGTVTHYLRGTPYIGVGEPSTHEVRAYRSGRQLVIEGLPAGAHAEWTDADGRVRWATDRAEGLEELRAQGHGTGILRWTLDGQRGVLKFVY